MDTDQLYNKDTTFAQKKMGFPVGMRVILLLIALSLLMELMDYSIFYPILTLGVMSADLILADLFVPWTHFFGLFLDRLLYLIIVVIVLIAAFYGILKRKIWARRLTIGWYTFVLGLSAFNFIVHFIEGVWAWLSPNPWIGMIILLFATAVTWAIGLTVIFYLKRRQDFLVS